MATAHTGTRAAEAGFELHVRRDDARGQLAAFFTAPPHDVLASRFSLQLVCGEREGANATTGTRRLERAAANRVHFFSLKSEQGAGSCDNLADAGDLWLQLLVERSGASAMGPAEVVAAVFAGTASQPQQPCTRQKQTPADERNLAAAGRRDEQRASFGTASTGSAARRRRSLRELRQFAQRVCAFWVCLFVCLPVLFMCVCVQGQRYLVIRVFPNIYAHTQFAPQKGGSPQDPAAQQQRALHHWRALTSKRPASSSPTTRSRETTPPSTAATMATNPALTPPSFGKTPWATPPTVPRKIDEVGGGGMASEPEEVGEWGSVEVERKIFLGSKLRLYVIFSFLCDFYKVKTYFISNFKSTSSAYLS